MSLKQYLRPRSVFLFIPIMILNLLSPAIASGKDINNMMCAAMCHTPERDKVGWKSRIESDTNLIVRNTLTNMHALPSSEDIKSAV